MKIKQVQEDAEKGCLWLQVQTQKSTVLQDRILMGKINSPLFGTVRRGCAAGSRSFSRPHSTPWMRGKLSCTRRHRDMPSSLEALDEAGLKRLNCEQLDSSSSLLAEKMQKPHVFMLTWNMALTSLPWELPSDHLERTCLIQEPAQQQQRDTIRKEGGKMGNKWKVKYLHQKNVFTLVEN